MLFGLQIFCLIAAAAVGLILLDRMGLWMESRGWIYYRKVKPRGGGMARTLRTMQELVEPEIRQVIEERQQHAALQENAAGETSRTSLPSDEKGESLNSRSRT